MAPFFNIDSNSLSLARISVLTFLDYVKLFPEMIPKWSLFLDQTPILKFRCCMSIFSNVLQNIAAFLLEENCQLLHLEISLAPLGYLLTGVLKLFLVNFHLKVVEEKFPWYRFIPCCVFLAEECFCWRKLPLCYIFLPENLLFLYSWLPFCRWQSNFLVNVTNSTHLVLKMRAPY